MRYEPPHTPIPNSTLKIILTYLILISSITDSFGQPDIQWQKCLGGTSVDFSYCINQTIDGGFIVAGLSNSNDGNVSGHHGTTGYSDYWLVKLNNIGSIEWQKTLGGTLTDCAYSIHQTYDAGYIVSGYSYSNDGDVTGHHGDSTTFDYWIIKVDSLGGVQWQQSFGGTNYDWGYSIQQTLDGGYIVAGASGSSDGDVIGNHGSNDFWILKLNSLGAIQWQKSLGGSKNDNATSIQQTIDGGFIVSGFTDSNDGDVTGLHDSLDFWVVKLDTVGDIMWEKCFGGFGNDLANSIQQTTDEGYIIVGQSDSHDGDLTMNHGGAWDYWILKIDSAGTIEWQKSLGGSDWDAARAVTQTLDGGYIVSGESISSDGDITSNHGNYDCWIVKLDSLGTVEWQKSFGGSGIDYAFSQCQTSDGGYVFTGFSASNDGDVSGNLGGDFWIIKLEGPSDIQTQNKSVFNFQVAPVPISHFAIIKFVIAQPSNIKLEIYDVFLKKIRTVIDSDLNPGAYSYFWEANDNSGNRISNGRYLIKIITNDYEESKTVLIIN